MKSSLQSSRKPIQTTVLIIFVTILLLLFPKQCSEGIRSGLTLSVTSLIPAIFPFMIFSNFVICSGYSKEIGHLLHPLFHRLFGTSEEGSYAVFMGFLCGYPLGSKILCDLIQRNRIRLEEGRYLFRFINNPSPAFLLAYTAPMLSLNQTGRIKALLLTVLPSLIIAIGTRKPDFDTEPDPDRIFPSQNPEKKSFGRIMDDSIMTSFLTTAKLTGYLMIFSLCGTLINSLPILPENSKRILSCFLELTLGIFHLSRSPEPPEVKFLFAVILSILGGFCVICQINSIVQGIDDQNNRSGSICMKSYLQYKLLAVFLCILLYFLLIAFHSFLVMSTVFLQKYAYELLSSLT